MKVTLINGSENPEELVCTAARNDYRSDGVIGYDFDEVVESIDPDDEHIEDHTTESSLLRSKTASKKRTLIDHLMRSGHWGPFEHPQAVVAIEGVTRVVTHQIVRHRHFSFDQQSLRYVEVEDLDDIEDQFQIPRGAKTGEFVSREGVSEVPETHGIFREAYEDALDTYRDLVETGVPKQEARKVLPMGIKTNIVMSGNARAWMHVLKVRTKADVQGETRHCAEAIFEELAEWMPYSMYKFDEMLPMELGP